MAQQLSIAASRRTTKGKGAARQLRRDGKVPGVIYGHHREPESLAFDAPALGRLLQSATRSTIIDVAIDGGASSKALIREIQRDALRSKDIVHIDFLAISADEAVKVSVGIKLVGTSDGVRNHGGVLDFMRHDVEIEVLPADIPELLEVDVTHLGVGQSIHVRDLSIPKAKVLTDGDVTVCAVLAARADDSAPAAEASPSEPELIRKAKSEEGEGEE
ncbi:MAG: 50S ribosomal protein L25 [Gemmatimonadales bacterium]|nr:50S ribosomal protein L25 [Gemmatimonadales bacterium]